MDQIFDSSPAPRHFYESRTPMVNTIHARGFNNKAELTLRKWYGFRTNDGIVIAFYQALGNLPEPKLVHEFC